MMTTAQFRSQFPEFSCASDYPDAQIDFWMELAGVMLRPDRWNDWLDYGTSLFVAHHLATGQRDQLAASAGGVPGVVNGPQASKSVDKVSASFDTAAVTLENGGFWNGSTYGIKLLQLARYAGAGGIQV